MTGDARMNLVERLIQMDKANPKRILVIGDIMTDMYVYGHLESCQEGCPKFVRESAVCVPGGAANAARCLSNWCSLARVVGDRTRAPVKTRFMDDNKCVFRYDDDRNTQNMETLHDTYITMLTEEKWDAILLSDYDKGLLTPDFIKAIVTVATKQGISCVADAKREPALYTRCIIKGNSTYFSNSYAEKARRMDTQAVTTNGQYPPIVWDRGKVYGFNDLQPVKCINHVGAGDCFATHLTLALAYGFSLKEAAAVAHSASRVYVQYRHNAPPRLDEIEKDMIVRRSHGAKEIR